MADDYGEGTVLDVQLNTPSITAAIVALAVNKTSRMARDFAKQYQADQEGHFKYLADELPTRTEAAKVHRRDARALIRQRLHALQRRAPMKIELGNVDLAPTIRTFAADFLADMGTLFPGLQDAAATMMGRANSGLTSPTGISHSAQAQIMRAQSLRATGVRRMRVASKGVMLAAARAGHAFVPGSVLQELQGVSLEIATADLTDRAQQYASGAEKEYEARMAMARALMAGQARVLTGVAGAVSGLLMSRIKAEDTVTRAIIDILGGRIDSSILRLEHTDAIEKAVYDGATAFANAQVSAVSEGELTPQDILRDDALRKTFIRNSAEMAATLYNSLRANARMSGSDADITDYDVLT